ncbi:hypothetical protein GQ42DRAFT_19855 [Ramicandelaber brevisporus]|nr:hypothetical protein GQ42DRAFT_19855 [Ramicandelaber brevisporus]
MAQKSRQRPKRRSASMISLYALFTIASSTAFAAVPSNFGSSLNPPWHGFHCAAIASSGSSKYMIVYGGVVGTEDINKEDVDKSKISNKVHVYDIKGQQWYEPKMDQLPPYPQVHHSCVTGDGGSRVVAYVPNANGTATANLQWLDTNYWTWSVPSPKSGAPPIGKLGSSFTATDNILVLYGGQTVDNNGLVTASSQIDNNVFTLDKSQMTWSYSANGLDRAFHSACYISDFGIVVSFGGRATAGIPLNDLSVYSVTSRSWQNNVVATGNTPSARSYATAVCTKDSMILFGGASGPNDGPGDSTVYRLRASSPTAFKWEPAPISSSEVNNGPSARMGHTAVLDENKVYIYGGFGPKKNGDLYILDISNQDNWSWSKVGGGDGSSSSSGANSTTVLIAALCGTVFGLIAIGVLGMILWKRYRRRKDNEKAAKTRENIAIGFDKLVAKRPTTKYTVEDDNNYNGNNNTSEGEYNGMRDSTMDIGNNINNNNKERAYMYSAGNRHDGEDVDSEGFIGEDGRYYRTDESLRRDALFLQDNFTDKTSRESSYYENPLNQRVRDALRQQGRHFRNHYDSNNTNSDLDSSHQTTPSSAHPLNPLTTTSAASAGGSPIVIDDLHHYRLYSQQSNSGNSPLASSQYPPLQRESMEYGQRRHSGNRPSIGGLNRGESASPPPLLTGNNRSVSPFGSRRSQGSIPESRTSFARDEVDMANETDSARRERFNKLQLLEREAGYDPFEGSRWDNDNLNISIHESSGIDNNVGSSSNQRESGGGRSASTEFNLDDSSEWAFSNVSLRNTGSLSTMPGSIAAVKYMQHQQQLQQQQQQQHQQQQQQQRRTSSREGSLDYDTQPVTRTSRDHIQHSSTLARRSGSNSPYQPTTIPHNVTGGSSQPRHSGAHHHGSLVSSSAVSTSSFGGASAQFIPLARPVTPPVHTTQLQSIFSPNAASPSADATGGRASADDHSRSASGNAALSPLDRLSRMRWPGRNDAVTVPSTIDGEDDSYLLDSEPVSISSSSPRVGPMTSSPLTAPQIGSGSGSGSGSNSDRRVSNTALRTSFTQNRDVAEYTDLAPPRVLTDPASAVTDPDIHIQASTPRELRSLTRSPVGSQSHSSLRSPLAATAPQQLSGRNTPVQHLNEQQPSHQQQQAGDASSLLAGISSINSTGSVSSSLPSNILPPSLVSPQHQPQPRSSTSEDQTLTTINEDDSNSEPFTGVTSQPLTTTRLLNVLKAADPSARIRKSVQGDQLQRNKSAKAVVVVRNELHMDENSVIPDTITTAADNNADADESILPHLSRFDTHTQHSTTSSSKQQE